MKWNPNGNYSVHGRAFSASDILGEGGPAGHRCLRESEGPQCRRRYELVVSPAIIREMAKVLRRDFGWREDRVQMAIRVVAQNARVVVPHSVLSVVTADPDDDRILECALDGKADIIVSNDHHLLDLRTYAAIPIVAGVDFRRTLGLK
jgi:uncharacterized protein